MTLLMHFSFQLRNCPALTRKHNKNGGLSRKRAVRGTGSFGKNSKFGIYCNALYIFCIVQRTKNGLRRRRPGTSCGRDRRRDGVGHVAHGVNAGRGRLANPVDKNISVRVQIDFAADEITVRLDADPCKHYIGGEFFCRACTKMGKANAFDPRSAQNGIDRRFRPQLDLIFTPRAVREFGVRAVISARR